MLPETPAVGLAALGRYLCLWLVFLVAGGRILAYTTTPLPWQQIVEDAQFVGVVECTTAGGFMARYRVQETWKGRETLGQEITIEIPLHFGGPLHPVTLVGERRFVALRRSKSPRWVNNAPNGIPSQWRNLPAEYGPLGTVVRLNQHGEAPARDIEHISGPRSRFSDVRKDVQAYLALSEEARAFALLQVLVAVHSANLSKRISTEKSAEAILIALREAWDSNGNGMRHKIERIISHSGSHNRSRMRELARTPTDVTHIVAKGETLTGISRTYLGSQSRAYEIADANRDVVESMDKIKAGTTLQISTRQGLVGACLTFPDAPLSPPVSLGPPAQSDLDAAELAFSAAGDRALELEEKATLLVKHRPHVIAAWLMAWKCPPAWATAHRGYTVGSWFASNCGGDRRAILTQMAEAAEPEVRTAAAVYLTFEDEAAGLARLRELSKLPGDAGAWAAVTLMRHGDRNAVARALSILETSKTDQQTLLGNMLDSRLCEILSNTAAANNIPASILLEKPTDIHVARYEAWRAQVATWAAYSFARNPDLVSVDPWLPELRRRQVD